MSVTPTLISFGVLLGAPLLGALTLGLLGARRWAPGLNVAFSLLTFLAACALTSRIITHGNVVLMAEQFFIDAFNVFLVTLTAFVGLTTSLFSRPYMRIEAERGHVSSPQLRLYHSMYQLFMATMLIALTTNNLGLMWVAMEAATLSTVLLVTLYRTPASLEAGWKYFILCGVGIAQALFGTILLYFAAEKILGAEGVSALLWTHLNVVKSQLEPAVLSLAFVFLLVGYGTKVGLAPLHNWLPDAHAEGPTPISAVLSGLLLNVAMYAVVRCKVLVEGSLQSSLPGRMLMGFGLLSVVLAAFFLWRQRDIKRLFAYSSIEHMGIITFAFGMGGAVANFAALLHMTVHSLTKSAIFFAVGHATQKAGSQLMEDIRGLITLSPTVGWGLMMGSLAILGMPPFGVFASEFLILTTAMKQQPWATPILLLALGVAFAAIFSRVQPMVFGETTVKRLPHPPALIPVFTHLALVLMLGVFIPPYLADWYRAAARLIGGE
ncbi:MAG TPA: hydrogenase 4 subunit F [Steroidobacter sp.]|uniref:hydrogenase 4 subunit F n=1 Tax=Steroidobacter sp. TaxID=1978227 RepID=UPI002ED9882A